MQRKLAIYGKFIICSKDQSLVLENEFVKLIEILTIEFVQSKKDQADYCFFTTRKNRYRANISAIDLVYEINNFKLIGKPKEIAKNDLEIK